MAHHVGVGVAQQPAVERNRHAAQNERTSRHQAVQVVAVADAERRRRALEQSFGQGQVSSGRDLHVARVPVHQVHGKPGLLDQRGLVGGIGASCQRRCAARPPETPAASAPGTDRPGARSPRQPPCSAALDRVGHLHRRQRRAVRGRGQHRALHQIGRHERPGRVVHHDDVGQRRHAGEGPRHRIAARGAPFDQRDGLGGADQIRRGCVQQVRRQRHHHIADERMRQQGVDAALQDRPAAELDQLFGLRGAHAGASSAGGDDG